MEESDKGRFLRTVLRKDVHDRLTSFAQSYSTGGAKWDYGVAIQILLDFFEQHSSVAQINMKLDAIVSLIQEQPEEEPVRKEPEKLELLGGEVLEK
jgi:hypothetical protein